MSHTIDLAGFSVSDCSEFVADQIGQVAGMSPSGAKTHILDKTDYSKHCLVTISHDSRPPLGSSSLRFRSKILGLTTNNLTYARHGHLMGWYDIYPLPSTVPAPYNDSEAYAHIAAWGYAEILGSTVPGISAGRTIYGFLPISSRVEHVRVDHAEHNGKIMNNHMIVLDQHRQHVWTIYNRLQVCESLAELERGKGIDSLGWDSLMQGLFATSYNLSTYAFAWNETNRTHPSGKGEWSAVDADLRDATIVILNASGKTGMSFAYNLRQNRPRDDQPKSIIGVGSPASVDTITHSGLYDQAVLNSEAEATASSIAQSGTRRILQFDFGARQGANEAWKSALSSTSVPFTLITVGGEVSVQDPEKARKRLATLGSTTLVHASNLREKGIEIEGAKYFDVFYDAFEEFKKRATGMGMKLSWGEGLEEWENGWGAFCRDEVRADTGLVYRL